MCCWERQSHGRLGLLKQWIERIFEAEVGCDCLGNGCVEVLQRLTCQGNMGYGLQWLSKQWMVGIVETMDDWNL